MSFFLETLVGGLLAGVMYALVAIGFVLIYKASGVFNFAQGAMVLCAALTFVTLREHGISFWLALAIALVVMVTLAIVVERVVLRPLINRPPLTLFMATLGLSLPCRSEQIRSRPTHTSRLRAGRQPASQ